MQCVFCWCGETNAGAVTVTLQCGDSKVIIKGVPAEVCAHCGESYLSEAISDEVLKLAEDAVKRGAEVEILRFAA